MDNSTKKFGSKFEFCDSKIENSNKLKTTIDNIYKKYKKIIFEICNAEIISRLNILKSNLELYRKVIEVNTIANINLLIKSDKLFC